MAGKCIGLIGLALWMGFRAWAPTFDVALAWDAAATDGSITNYNVYWGTLSATYTNFIGSGTNLTATVAQLPRFIGRYFFAATATDTNGAESDYSNEVWVRAAKWQVLGTNILGRMGPRRLGNGTFR